MTVGKFKKLLEKIPDETVILDMNRKGQIYEMPEINLLHFLKVKNYARIGGKWDRRLLYQCEEGEKEFTGVLW